MFAFLVFLVTLFGAGALAIVHISRASANVVYADTWGHIRQWSDISCPAGFFSRSFSRLTIKTAIVLNMILLLSARYDHLDLIHVEYLSVVFAIVTVIMIVYFCQQMFEGNYPLMFIVLSVAILLMLSLSQWENFLLPINIVFFSTINFSVCSILLLHRHLFRNSSNRLWVDFFGAILLSALALFFDGRGNY